jgi:hypothetical protein
MTVNLCLIRGKSGEGHGGEPLFRRHAPGQKLWKRLGKVPPAIHLLAQFNSSVIGSRQEQTNAIIREQITLEDSGSANFPPVHCNYFNFATSQIGTDDSIRIKRDCVMIITRVRWQALLFFAAKTFQFTPYGLGNETIGDKK